MKSLLFPILLLLTNFAYCEKTKGITKMFSHESKIETATLFNGIEISCGLRHSNLIEISCYVYTSTEYLNDNYPNPKKPTKGTFVYDSLGKIIGVINSDSIAFQPYQGKKNGKFLIQIYGLISIDNLTDTVYPEMALNKITSLPKKKWTIETLRGYIKKFEFSKKVDNYLNLKGYQFYYYSSNDFGDYAIELVFKNRVLVGLLYTNSLKIEKVIDANSIDDRYNLIWFSNSLNEKERFIKNYLEVTSRECCGG